MRTCVAAGLAVVCGHDGTVTRWLHDDYGLQANASAHRNVIRLLDDSSHLKGLEFLSQLRHGAPVVAWELCLSIACEPTLVRVAGAPANHGSIVLAAQSDEALSALCCDLATRYSEATGPCAVLLTALQPQRKTQPQKDVYEELMRLYNDLACLQRSYANQNAKLERMNEERHRMMCMTVHDLRNPLTVMVMLATTLSQAVSDRLTSEELYMLDNISKTGKQMSDSLSDVLEMMRLNPGAPKLKLAEQRLDRLIEESMGQLRHLADKKHIGLQFHCTPYAAPLHCDAIQMRHVLDNLIGNAIKFSPSETCIDISLSSADQAQRIVVRDRGPGIPEGELARIFKAFEKGSTKPTAGEASSGLGLSICRNIVEKHGGRIWAKNHSSGGAMFIIDLPDRAGAC